MAGSTSTDWTELLDITDEAEREFLALPREVKDAFYHVFPELCAHPTRRTPTLDVGPVRNFPGHFRLSVAGHRAIFSMRHGRPLLRHFGPAHEPYAWLRRNFRG